MESNLCLVRSAKLSYACHILFNNTVSNGLSSLSCACRYMKRQNDQPSASAESHRLITPNIHPIVLPPLTVADNFQPKPTSSQTTATQNTSHHKHRISSIIAPETRPPTPPVIDQTLSIFGSVSHSKSHVKPENGPLREVDASTESDSEIEPDVRLQPENPQLDLTTPVKQLQEIEQKFEQGRDTFIELQHQQQIKTQELSGPTRSEDIEGSSSEGSRKPGANENEELDLVRLASKRKRNRLHFFNSDNGRKLRLGNFNHMPIMTNSDTYCALCGIKKGGWRGHKTKLACEACHVHLCCRVPPKLNKTCWRIWHTDHTLVPRLLKRPVRQSSGAATARTVVAAASSAPAFASSSSRAAGSQQQHSEGVLPAYMDDIDAVCRKSDQSEEQSALNSSAHAAAKQQRADEVVGATLRGDASTGAEAGAEAGAGGTDGASAATAR